MSAVHEESQPTTEGEAHEAVTATAPARVPAPVLLIGAGGVLLILGAFLPWATIFVIKISGIDSHFGITALVTGLLALVVAVQLSTRRLLAKSAERPLVLVAGGLGVVSILAVVYVIAKLSSVANAVNAEEADNPLAQAFQPSIGFGVWVTILAATVLIAGVVLQLRRTTAPALTD